MSRLSSRLRRVLLRAPAVAPTHADHAVGVTRWLAATVVLLFAVGASALIWAAQRYETGERQRRLDHELAEVAQSMRSRLLRDAQSLQLAAAADPHQPSDALRTAQRAAALLAERPELSLIELRDASGAARAVYVSPLSRTLGAWLARRTPLPHEASIARSAALQGGAAVFSRPFFVPLPDYAGVEVVELWVPLDGDADGSNHALRAVYSLSALLTERVPGEFARDNDLALTEADGTYLARRSAGGRGRGVYRARALIDLPGATFVLRADSLRGAPRLIPNLLTGLVIALSAALLLALARLTRDMKRRARAESALREAYAFRRAMEDSLVTGLRARDLDGRITYVNPAFCEMVGLPAPQLLGSKPPMPYWAPEAIDEHEQRHAQVLAGTITEQGFESTWVRADGTRFPVLIHEAPLVGADGRHTGWMASVIDLTDQKRAEEINRQQHEKLQQAARMATMGELATVLSHELNQPLAAISSYATGATNLIGATPGAAPAPRLQEDLREALTRIATQAQRAGQIIRRVNDFMRRRDVRRERLDAAELVGAQRPLIELQARKAAVRLRMALPIAPAWIEADRVMMEQVLLNLTRNGIEAMQALPRERRVLEVRVTSGDDGAAVRIEVTDRGTGISPEVAARLFTPFFSTKPEGLGMGLSICRSMAEHNGGRLWHEPRDGGGTRFVLSLPVAGEEATAPAEAGGSGRRAEAATTEARTTETGTTQARSGGAAAEPAARPANAGSTT